MMDRCERYGHSWTADVRYLNEEDAISTAAVREIECECCGVGVDPNTPRDVAEEIIYGWMD